jgi:hypothetical protein
MSLTALWWIPDEEFWNITIIKTAQLSCKCILEQSRLADWFALAFDWFFCQASVLQHEPRSPWGGALLRLDDT